MITDVTWLGVGVGLDDRNGCKTVEIPDKYQKIYLYTVSYTELVQYKVLVSSNGNASLALVYSQT